MLVWSIRSKRRSKKRSSNFSQTNSFLKFYLVDFGFAQNTTVAQHFIRSGFVRVNSVPVRNTLYKLKPYEIVTLKFCSKFSFSKFNFQFASMQNNNFFIVDPIFSSAVYIPKS